MIDFPYLDEIVQKTDSKILMLVVDGLGGAPDPLSRRTELETAGVPNLDQLAQESACGLTIPVTRGVAPGSGPGHLALFGYDPLKFLIGRGVLEALGIDMEMRPGDVAARGNFATVDKQGLLTDRRAGRIASESAKPLCEQLNGISVDGVDLTVQHVQDYRFVLRLRGNGVSEQLTESDPLVTGAKPLAVKARTRSAQATAQVANAFVEQAVKLLKGQPQANTVLLRGWSQLPKLPDMGKGYGLKPAAIAAYPMYRGLAQLLGMKVLPTGHTFAEEVETLRRNYAKHDFFYLHYKPADAAGEDGDFEAKKQALEALDEFIPSLLELKPDVLMVAGDHATPSSMAAHSWHPVPFLLHSLYTHGEGVDRFSERACRQGSLGQFEAKHIMLTALAHAGKLLRFGP